MAVFPHGLLAAPGGKTRALQLRISKPMAGKGKAFQEREGGATIEGKCRGRESNPHGLAAT